MLFLKIAWQTMRRHWKQTLVILFAIAASEFTLMFVSSMLEGIKANFYTGLVRQSGHVQIHSAGWEDSLDRTNLDLVIADASPLIRTIAAMPGVLHAEGSLLLGALAISGNKNISMQVVGVDPDTFFYEKARTGTQEGEFLPLSGGVAISESTSRLLGVALGEPITLLTEDVWGSPWYISRDITSIFITDSLEFDQNILLVDRGTAEELSGLQDSVSEIRIDLADPETAATSQESLSNGIAATDEILTWREINGSMLVFIEVFDYMLLGIDLLLIIVAGTVITNAVLMSVFARTQELGTLRAIGLKRRALLGLVLTEGMIEGIIGVLVGILLALPLILSFRGHGLSFGTFTDAFGLGNSINFVLTPFNIIRDVAAGICIAMFGTLYAGSIIARTSIMDTLKQG